MTARKRLDEMKQFIKIAEGAWSLPRSKEDFDKLAAILRSKEPNVKIQDMLYNILGDDNLFDRLDKLDLQRFDAPETIIQWMKDQRKDPHSNFPNIWNTFQLSQREDSPMNEEDFGPAARGKSDIMKKYGAQQSIEVSDLKLSKDDDTCIDCGGPIQDPDAKITFSGPEKAERCEDCDWARIEKETLADFDDSDIKMSDDEYMIRSVARDNYFDEDLDEDPEEFKNIIANPQWKERRTAEIQKRKDWLRRTYQNGEPVPDDLYMARVKTPKGTGTVYSINNYEPMEAHDYPTVSVRLDNDPGGFGGGKLQYIFKLSDVEILSDKLDEVGDVKFDDYGAVPVYEDDPEPECPYCNDEEPVNDMPCLNCGSLQYVDEDQKFRVRPHDPWMPDTPVPDEFKRDGRVMKRRKGYQAWLQAERDKVRDTSVQEDRDEDSMGHYNVVIQYPDKRYDDELNAEPLPYPEAISLAQEHIGWVERGFPKTEIVSKREDKGDSVTFKISEFDKFDNSLSEVYTVIVQPADEADVFDSFNLDHIVENLLQEYPGQTKDDYDDLEADQAEFDAAIDAGAEMDDFLDEIDPEIADEELGYRFD